MDIRAYSSANDFTLSVSQSASVTTLGPIMEKFPFTSEKINLQIRSIKYILWEGQRVVKLDRLEQGSKSKQLQVSVCRSQ